MFLQWSSLLKTRVLSLCLKIRQKLPKKWLLNAHRLRKFRQIFTEKHCLQHKSRKLVNYSSEEFGTHSTYWSKRYEMPCFPWGCDWILDLWSSRLWRQWTLIGWGIKPVLLVLASQAMLILLSTLEEELFKLFFPLLDPETLFHRGVESHIEGVSTLPDLFFSPPGNPDHSKTHKDKEILISLLHVIAKAAQPDVLLQGEIERMLPFIQKNVGQDTFFLSKKRSRDSPHWAARWQVLFGNPFWAVQQVTHIPVTCLCC